MKKIMIVDDDLSIVDAIKSILELYNYEVTTCSNGSTLVQIHECQPDLLLLDIWMPGIDGKTLCKSIKEDPLIKGLPIVIISASKNVKKDASDAGANDYLEKPFEMDTLLAMVSKYVK